MTDTVPEQDPWQEIADELHRIADDALKLVGQPAPAAVALNIQPKPHFVPEAIAAVDTIALALLGRPGETKDMGGGAYHRDAQASRGLINVAVYRRVPEPHTAEIARLEARIAELKALDGYPAEPAPEPEHYQTTGWTGGDGGSGAACACGVQFDGFDTYAEASAQLANHIADPGGLDYSRTDGELAPGVALTVITPTDPAVADVALTRPGRRVEPHTGGVTDEGLVDETGYGLIVGDTADEQRSNAYAAYERDEAEYLDLPRCPNCHGRHDASDGCH